MTRWNEGSPAKYLPADLVLSQAEIGVIVADMDGNILFANEHVARLLRLAGEAAALAGQPLEAAGLIHDENQAEARTVPPGAVRHGRGRTRWPARRGDGTLVFVREFAVPLRGASGEIDGMVVLVSEAGRRDAQREPDRLRLLERIGERLAGSLELDATLRHVAQILVPQVRRPLLHRPVQRRQADQARGGARGRLGAAAGHLGAGRRGHQLPAGALHASRPCRGSRRSSFPTCRPTSTRRRAEESMSAADQAGVTSVLGVAAVRARRAARRDLAGAVAASPTARTRTTTCPTAT